MVCCDNCGSEEFGISRVDFVPFGAQEDTVQMLQVWISHQHEGIYGWDWEHHPARWCAACWEAAARGRGKRERKRRGRVFRGDVELALGTFPELRRRRVRLA